MWNSQLEQHLDRIHHDDADDDDIDEDSTMIEENEDNHRRQPIRAMASRHDENSSPLQKKHEHEEASSPCNHSQRTISHPSLATTRAITTKALGFDIGDEWTSACTIATLLVLAVSWHLSETTTTTSTTTDTHAADVTGVWGRTIILSSWLGMFSTLFTTFLAGWHGGKLSSRSGGRQSSYHEEEKSMQTLDVEDHQQAVVKEVSWKDDHHRRVIGDDEVFISKSPAAGCSSSYRHELRLRLVELLGTIGAPPLVLEQDETSITNDDDHHHHNNSIRRLESGEKSLTQRCGKLLIEFCEAQVEWIQTLDRALDLLRASTSIQFGGGGTRSVLRNNVVERMERAAVGRWRRCQRQATATKATTKKQNIVTRPLLHLPLARIRRRCAEALQRQQHCLQSILLTAGEVVEKECVEKGEIPFDNTVMFNAVIDMNVITIHSLRLARDEIAVLLARLVDQSIKRHASAVASFSENDCAQQLGLLQQATQQTREEEVYLRACCRFTPSMSNVADDEVNEGIWDSCSELMLDPLNQGVASLQMTTSALQVALLSFQDVIVEQRQSAEEAGGREIMKDWWQRVDSLTRTMLASKHDVEHVVLQTTYTAKGNNVDEESSNDNAIGDALAINPTDDKQDFVADAIQAVPGPSPTKHHDELHSSKTLLFSGSGTVVCKEKRFEKMTKINFNDTSYSASKSSIAVEQSLIHELETYLRCMPAPEEVNVTASTTDLLNIPNDDNENNSVLATTADAADPQPYGLLSTLPAQYHGLFLGELTSSIQKHSNTIFTDNTDGTGEEESGGGSGDHWESHE